MSALAGPILGRNKELGAQHSWAM